jgi:type II secretion system (T2SS) protein B
MDWCLNDMTRQANSIYFFILATLPLTVSSNAELPDPTRPANFFVQDTEPIYIEEIFTKEKVSWRVSAIRISPDDRSAIVNGKLVRVGDEVSSATIAEINPLSVVVDYEDRKLIVRLFNNQVIKKYKSPR